MTSVINDQYQANVSRPGTSSATSALWARAERSLAVASPLARKEVLGVLRSTGFRIDAEQLAAVSASRGSHYAGVSRQLDKLPLAATVRFLETATGCGVVVELNDRWPNGLGRAMGAESAYRVAFEQILHSLDTALGRIDPSVRAGISNTVYSSPAVAAQTAAALQKNPVSILDMMNNTLNKKHVRSTSRGWQGVKTVWIVSPKGYAALDAAAVQLMATIGTQIVDNPGSIPAENISRIAALVTLLDQRLSDPTASGQVRIDVSAEQAPVVEFLRQQARIRDQVELRMRQRCLTCDFERVTNPDYKTLVQKNQMTKALLGSFGGIIGRGGISPIVLFGKLAQVKQLDPDFVCPRCQGMHDQAVAITFCPSCRGRRDESVLRTCPGCKYDFNSCLPAESLWQQEAPALPQQPAAASQLQVPAAWYPDPHGAAALRWWDGVSWTEHLHVAQPATAAEPTAPTSSTGPTADTAASAPTGDDARERRIWQVSSDGVCS